MNHGSAEGPGRYPRGIGVSEQAALFVKGDTGGKRFTARRITNPWVDEAPVYFIRPLEAPSLCQPGAPLTVRHVEVRKLADVTTVFDLTNWSGVDGYLVNVQAGNLGESPY